MKESQKRDMYHLQGGLVSTTLHLRHSPELNRTSNHNRPPESIFENSNKFRSGNDSEVPTLRYRTCIGGRGREEGSEGGKRDVVGVCDSYDCEFLLLFKAVDKLTVFYCCR